MSVQNDSTRYIQQLINNASPGDNLVLPAGEYSVAIYVDKSLTLVGSGAKTLFRGVKDGGAVIVIVEDGLNITFRNLAITGGFDLKGGGVALKGDSHLTIENCMVWDNVATYYGGGGIYVKKGQLTVIRSQILRNTAILGGGVLIDSGARAIFESSLIVENSGRQGGGGICLKESASAEILRCTLAENRVLGGPGDNIYLWGSMTAQPSVRITDSVLAEQEPGRSITVSECGGNIDIANSFLSPGHRGSFPIRDDRDNLYAPVIFELSGTAKYSLGPDSPGAGLGSTEFLDEETQTLLGRNWLSDRER